MKPRIEGAPGLQWKPRKDGWEARWVCRADLIRKGFVPKTIRIWAGNDADLTPTVQEFIAGRCSIFQTEMLVWANGGIPVFGGYSGTLKSLIESYKSDPLSAYNKKLRHVTKQHYNDVCASIIKEYGHQIVGEMNGRMFMEWYEKWTSTGHISMGHVKMQMLRTLLTFGCTLLDQEDCRRARSFLRDMKFQMGKPRNERLSADQARAIIAKAHDLGKHSIALAQAFQFEAMLRQKDVIGEWVPLTERGPLSDVVHGNNKWIRGLRWEEISDDLILRHVTSKKQKEIEVDLKLAPMVMAELSLLGSRPQSGPVIISERQQQPWHGIAFRRAWRQIANSCGISKDIRNMDTRAGAISEATDAGADLEHVRHAATHSDIAMTQRYSRNSADKTATVQKLRVEHRNKTGTE